MKKNNWLREQIASGRCVRSIWLELASPAVAEAAVWAGWDCVMIDNEHGPAGLETTANMLRAIEAAGGHALVRAPWNDQVYLKRLMEIGAKSIMVPMICDKEAAEAAVAATHYPPKGTRGYAAPVGRASHYGTNTDYLHSSNDELFLIAQIEHKDAIPNIEEIAAVDGIDMLFIGPNDLAGTIGLLEQLGEDAAEELSATAEARITATGKLMGTVGRPRWTFGELKDRGHSLLIGPGDIGLFMSAAQAAARDMDKETGQTAPKPVPSSNHY
ncbi:HpcH/HpaI aldolase family protein [Cohaesibacter celericrescens]|uniref:Aldolase n=1 Tax=Cohaesibacter celericrescens TaxID=2067669 RepID=A0A2N5XLB3_9HYPH|nr:aldolase/citrate lyase family protein [Cohaesibacter celericrescens]PLW75321.1 aldolase [Cohaesibacter celericrescens]